MIQPQYARSWITQLREDKMLTLCLQGNSHAVWMRHLRYWPEMTSKTGSFPACAVMAHSPMR